MSDRCFVLPDGSCVSPFDCEHGPPNQLAVNALQRLNPVQPLKRALGEYGRTDTGKIPVEFVRDMAHKFDLKQTIVVAWDGNREHVSTYGTSLGDADNAAEGGNFVKQALHWPPETYTTSGRVEAFVKAANELLDRMDERARSVSQGHGELSFHREATVLRDLLVREGFRS